MLRNLENKFSRKY